MSLVVTSRIFSRAALYEKYEGSFEGFMKEFRARHQVRGTALDFVRMVTNNFPSFRDEVLVDGMLGPST